MRTVITALYLASIAAAAIIPPRDHATQLLPRDTKDDLPQYMLTPPKKRAYKIEKIATETGVAGAERVRLTYGPFKLRGAKDPNSPGNVQSMDKDGGTGYSFTADADFPVDITVLSFRTELLDDKFQRTNGKSGIYSHHNLFMAETWTLDWSFFSCSNKMLPQVPMPVRFLGGGATEMAEINYYSPDHNLKSGLYLGKLARIVGTVDAVNYNESPVDSYISVEMEYMQGNPPGYKLATQQVLIPGACSESVNGVSVHQPAGQKKFSIETKDVVITRPGTIVRARGHLHDGGVDVNIQLNNQTICDSTAKYGGEGFTYQSEGKTWDTISETTECALAVPVKKGDRISMRASYDTELHPSREMAGHKASMSMGMGGEDGGADQMGVALLYIAEA